MPKKHVATLKGPRNRVYHFTKEQVEELRSTIDPQLWGLLDTNPMRFAGSDMTGVRAQVTVGGKRYTLDHQDVAELFRQVQVLPFPVGTRLALAEDHEIASGEVFDRGTTGIVSQYGDGWLWLRLDNPPASLATTDGELVFALGQYLPLVPAEGGSSSADHFEGDMPRVHEEAVAREAQKLTVFCAGHGWTWRVSENQGGGFAFRVYAKGDPKHTYWTGTIYNGGNLEGAIREVRAELAS